MIGCLLCLQGNIPPLDLPVPEIDVAHVLLRHDDQICHADASALTQPVERWRQLEAPLGAGGSPRCELLISPCAQHHIAGHHSCQSYFALSKFDTYVLLHQLPPWCQAFEADAVDAWPSWQSAALLMNIWHVFTVAEATAASSWLDGPSSRASGASARPPTVVADEPLTLTVRVSNPMALPLRLSQLRVACTHSLSRDEASLADYVQVCWPGAWVSGLSSYHAGCHQKCAIGYAG